VSERRRVGRAAEAIGIFFDHLRRLPSRTKGDFTLAERRCDQAAAAVNRAGSDLASPIQALIELARAILLTEARRAQARGQTPWARRSDPPPR
jgi:hypothetical protein